MSFQKAAYYIRGRFTDKQNKMTASAIVNVSWRAFFFFPKKAKGYDPEYCLFFFFSLLWCTALYSIFSEEMKAYLLYSISLQTFSQYCLYKVPIFISYASIVFLLIFCTGSRHSGRLLCICVSDTKRILLVLIQIHPFLVIALSCWGSRRI